MDVLGILRDKLGFIRTFHKTASVPFLTVKAKIENSEEPFTYSGSASDEPPFLLEWVDSCESLNLLGQSCLCLVHRSFKDFLIGFIRNTNRVPPKGQNWFKGYKSFFLDEYHIDWDKGPVEVRCLKELNVARNIIQHFGAEHDVYRLARTQHVQYSARSPRGLFASDADKDLWSKLGQRKPARIEITGEKLELAISVVDDFCSWVDAVYRGRVGQSP